MHENGKAAVKRSPGGTCQTVLSPIMAGLLRGLYAIDALFLIGYGLLCILYSQEVCKTILTKTPVDALPFAEILLKVAG